MMTLIHRFLGEQKGAVAIEYAMIAVGIAVAIAATVTTVGNNVNSFFAKVASYMH